MRMSSSGSLYRLEDEEEEEEGEEEEEEVLAWSAPKIASSEQTCSPVCYRPGPGSVISRPGCPRSHSDC